MFGQIFNPFAAKLVHDLLKLGLEHTYSMVAPVFTQGSRTVKKGPAHKSELGPASHGTGNIGTGA